MELVAIGISMASIYLASIIYNPFLIKCHFLFKLSTRVKICLEVHMAYLPIASNANWVHLKAHILCCSVLESVQVSMEISPRILKFRTEYLEFGLIPYNLTSRKDFYT